MPRPRAAKVSLQANLRLVDAQAIADRWADSNAPTLSGVIEDAILAVLDTIEQGQALPGITLAPETKLRRRYKVQASTLERLNRVAAEHDLDPQNIIRAAASNLARP